MHAPAPAEPHAHSAHSPLQVDQLPLPPPPQVPLSLKLSTDLGDAFESLGSLFNFDGIRTSWVALSIFTGLGATGVGLLRVPLSTGFRIVGVVANGWGLLLSCVFIPLTGA